MSFGSCTVSPPPSGVPSLEMKHLRLDEENFRMDAEDLCDRLVAMRRQEETYACVDYLAEEDVTEAAAMAMHCDASIGESIDPENLPVDEDCRIAMCEWTYQVCDFFKFSRETVYIAISYVDRFLSCPKNRDFLLNRTAYQLTVITALHMAIKTHEPASLDVDLLLKLGRDAFTVKQIVDMEAIMMHSLQWKLNPPTPWAFVQHMVALLPQNCMDKMTRQTILDVARFQCELSIFQYGLTVVNRRASCVALAAILNAMDGIDQRFVSPGVRQGFLHLIAVKFNAHPLSCPLVAVARRALLISLSESKGFGGPVHHQQQPAPETLSSPVSASVSATYMTKPSTPSPEEETAMCRVSPVRVNMFSCMAA